MDQRVYFCVVLLCFMFYYKYKSRLDFHKNIIGESDDNRRKEWKLKQNNLNQGEKNKGPYSNEWDTLVGGTDSGTKEAKEEITEALF